VSGQISHQRHRTADPDPRPGSDSQQTVPPIALTFGHHATELPLCQREGDVDLVGPAGIREPAGPDPPTPETAWDTSANIANTAVRSPKSLPTFTVATPTAVKGQPPDSTDGCARDHEHAERSICAPSVTFLATQEAAPNGGSGASGADSLVTQRYGSEPKSLRDEQAGRVPDLVFCACNS